MDSYAYLFKTGLLYRRRVVRFRGDQAAFQQGCQKGVYPYNCRRAAHERFGDEDRRHSAGNAGDILASAKDINEKRAAKEAEEKAAAEIADENDEENKEPEE